MVRPGKAIRVNSSAVRTWNGTVYLLDGGSGTMAE